MATKVIAFIRVSTHQQDFTAQREKVINEILRDGYTKDDIKVVEGKESATKTDYSERKTIEEMNRIIDEEKTVEAVYTFALDRIARKLQDELEVVDNLKKKGVSLVILSPERLKTLKRDDKGELIDDPFGHMVMVFLAEVAALEIKMKNARVKEVKDKMKKEGKVIGGKPQLGYYKKEDKTIGVASDKAKLIKDLFNDYLIRDIGLKTLYREYRDKGLLPPTKSEAARLQAIFRDLTYSGKREHYPQIVSEELQQKVIDKMKMAKSLPRNETRNVYLAKGILRDYNSNIALEGAGQKGCYRTRTEGKVNTININAVDSIAWDVAIKLKALQLAHQQISMEEEYKEQFQQEKDRLQRLEADIKNVNTKQEKAFSMLIDGKVTDEVYHKKNNELTEQLNYLRKQKDKSQQTVELLERLIKTEGSTLIVREKNISETTDDTTRRQIIKEVIKTIYIDLSDSTSRKLFIEPLHRYRITTALPHHYFTRIGKGYKTEIYEAWQHPDGTFAEIPFTGKFLHRYKMDKNKCYHYVKEETANIENVTPVIIEDSCEEPIEDATPIISANKTSDQE